MRLQGKGVIIVCVARCSRAIASRRSLLQVECQRSRSSLLTQTIRSSAEIRHDDPFGFVWQSKVTRAIKAWMCFIVK